MFWVLITFVFNIIYLSVVSSNLVFNNGCLTTGLQIPSNLRVETSRFNLNISGGPGNIPLQQAGLLLWAMDGVVRGGGLVGWGWRFLGQNYCSVVFLQNTASLKKGWGAFLVAHWLRIRLPTQGTRVQALVREDPTCRRATKTVHHNYWACALEPASHNYWTHVPQLLKPVLLEPVLCNKRSHHNEKLAHRNEE